MGSRIGTVYANASIAKERTLRKGNELLYLKVEDATRQGEGSSFHASLSSTKDASLRKHYDACIHN